MTFSPKPKPEPKEKKAPKPLKRSYIKVKPKAERRVMPKSERTLLEAEADRLCSLIVRARDGKCVTCGSKYNLTCSHFIKRADQYLRFDIELNLNCQCLTCNENHNVDRTAYTAYMYRKYGKKSIDLMELGVALVTYFSWDVTDLREIVDGLKSEAEFYGIT